jgi:UDP-N-acetylglucosamine 2-epimerase (non-hydrolysing)
MTDRPKLICVAGARPNFMKVAPVIAALKERDRFDVVLVHTGQHYDPDLNDRFFEDLGIPQPDYRLEVGSGSHAVQTGTVMIRFEPVLDEVKPAAVIVVGDVNSTLACALVAAKKGVPVAHVESGLRSYDREMPEEINRVITDSISDILFTTERSALANLQREGVDESRVEFVGNVMIDSVLNNVRRAVPSAETLGSDVDPAKPYALLTLHRPSNVDEKDVLEGLIRCMGGLTDRLNIIFGMHPRTRARIESFGFEGLLAEAGVITRPPFGYLEMLGLVRDARMVLTDSGGLQEETTALGVPCLTLRNNTERPITIEEGTNYLVGNDPAAILATANDVLANGGKAGRQPEYWDGRASFRIADVLERTCL